MDLIFNKNIIMCLKKGILENSMMLAQKILQSFILDKIKFQERFIDHFRT